MKQGVLISAAIIVLVVWLWLQDDAGAGVIEEFDGNPYIDALPRDIDYWISLINGALVSLYGGGEEGASLNDSALITAIAWQESAFNPAVIGLAGEIGLCQILPSTGAALGYTIPALYDPAKNAQCSFALVREIRTRNNIDPLYKNFPSEVAVVLGGYNAGIAGEKNPAIVSAYVNQVWDRFEAIQIHMGLIQVITV